MHATSTAMKMDNILEGVIAGLMLQRSAVQQYASQMTCSSQWRIPLASHLSAQPLAKTDLEIFLKLFCVVIVALKHLLKLSGQVTSLRLSLQLSQEVEFWQW